MVAEKKGREDEGSEEKTWTCKTSDLVSIGLNEKRARCLGEKILDTGLLEAS